MRLSWIRISRWGVVLAAPLLAAPACDDANLTIANTPILSAPVGRLETRSVSVVNTGGVDAKLGEVSAAALGLQAPFSVIPGGTCTSGAIVRKSHGSCTLLIGFNAREAREYTDSLALAYGWADGAENGTLTAQVVGVGEPPLRTTSDFYGAFLKRPLGSVTHAELVVQNVGGYTLTLGDVSSPQLDLAPPFFAEGGTCASGAALAPNATCTIAVRFVPTTIDTFDDALAFSYNWAESGAAPRSHYVAVHGSTVVPVTVSAEPTMLAPVPVGGSAVQTLTIRNSGGEIAVLGTIDAAALGLAPPFALAGGSCATGLALAPNGGSCTLDVAFSASTPGAANANLVIRYGWGGSAIAFSVSHAIPATAVAPSSTDCYATGCAAGQVCAQITSSAAGAGTCVSVPAPPPGCMAPCIWEARKNCL
ncbi:MAG TPA: choice-of-anchor D domain-containing protein, partial [Polyangiaceae bacterium]